MSTEAPAGTSARSDRSPFGVTVRYLLRGQLRLAGWAAAVLAAAVAIVLLIVAAVATPEVSIVQFGRQAAIWFPFSQTIALVAGYLAMHVAAGQDRRSFGRATVAVALIMSLVYGGIMTLALLVERLVFRAAGWQHALTEGFPPLPDGASLAATGAGFVLLTGTGMVSGLLVGIVYHRFGAVRGTLLLPLTVGPILLAMAVHSVERAWVERVGVDLPAAADGPVRVLITVLLLAVVASVYAHLVRRAEL